MGVKYFCLQAHLALANLHQQQTASAMLASAWQPLMLQSQDRLKAHRFSPYPHPHPSFSPPAPLLTKTPPVTSAPEDTRVSAFQSVAPAPAQKPPSSPPSPASSGSPSAAPASELRSMERLVTGLRGGGGGGDTGQFSVSHRGRTLAQSQ